MPDSIYNQVEISEDDDFESPLKQAMKDLGDDFDIDDPNQIFHRWNFYADASQKTLLKIKEIQNDNRDSNDHRKQGNTDAVKQINELMKQYDSQQFITNILYQKMNIAWKKHGINLEHERIVLDSKSEPSFTKTVNPQSLKMLYERVALNNKLEPEIKEFINLIFNSINKSAKRYKDQADELVQKIKKRRFIITGISIIAVILIFFSYLTGKGKTKIIKSPVYKYIEKQVIVEKEKKVFVEKEKQVIVEKEKKVFVPSNGKDTIIVDNKLLFESSKTIVKNTVFLFGAIKKLNGNSKLILVDGHTDPIPLKIGSKFYKKYHSNGLLSKIRAQNIAIAISKKHPEKIIGYIGSGAKLPVTVESGIKWGNVDFQASRRVELSQFKDEYKKITNKTDEDIIKDLAAKGYTMLKNGVKITIK